MALDANMQILVADDFKSMRNLIKGILNQIGFRRIIEANDGKEAWEMIEAHEISLVISDWNMPNMTGIELLRKVRQSQQYKDTPFLMVTAEGVKDNVIEALQSGVSGYIVKPFSPASMRDKIQKIFAKRAQG